MLRVRVSMFVLSCGSLIDRVIFFLHFSSMNISCWVGFFSCFFLLILLNPLQASIQKGAKARWHRQTCTHTHTHTHTQTHTHTHKNIHTCTHTQTHTLYKQCQRQFLILKPTTMTDILTEMFYMTAAVDGLIALKVLT